MELQELKRRQKTSVSNTSFVEWPDIEIVKVPKNVIKRQFVRGPNCSSNKSHRVIQVCLLNLC